MISPIYHQGPSPEPTGRDAEHRNKVAYQTAWHRHGLIILDPETITDDWLKQAFINEAVKRFGRRAE